MYSTFYTTLYTTFYKTFQLVLTSKTVMMALVHQSVPVTCSIWANLLQNSVYKVTGGSHHLQL